MKHKIGDLVVVLSSDAHFHRSVKDRVAVVVSLAPSSCYYVMNQEIADKFYDGDLKATGFAVLADSTVKATKLHKVLK